MDGITQADISLVTSIISLVAAIIGLVITIYQIRRGKPAMSLSSANGKTFQLKFIFTFVLVSLIAMGVSIYISEHPPDVAVTPIDHPSIVSDKPLLNSPPINTSESSPERPLISIIEAKSPKEPTRLSSLHADSSTFTNIRYDSDANMKIGNEEHKYGVQLYECSYNPSPNDYIAYFSLNGDYSLLIGRVGFDDGGNDTGDATVYFRNESNVILDTKTIIRGNLFTVDIDVSGVKQLKITSQTTTSCKYIDLIDMELYGA